MDELVLMAVDYNIMDQDDASTHSSLPELLDPDNWVSDSSDDETEPGDGYGSIDSNSSLPELLDPDNWDSDSSGDETEPGDWYGSIDSESENDSTLSGVEVVDDILGNNGGVELAVLASSAGFGEDLFLADTGASVHCTGVKIGLTDLKSSTCTVSAMNSGQIGEDLIGSMKFSAVDKDGNVVGEVLLLPCITRRNSSIISFLSHSC